MSQFKILHFADAHLGLKLYGFEQRILDHSRALGAVAHAAIANGVDLVIDAGDTFNNPEPDPHSVKAYQNFAHDLYSAQIPLISIVGNHNVHRISTRFQDSTWVDMRHVSRPISSPTKARIVEWPNRANDMVIRLVAADWMPAAAIEGFLSQFVGMDESLDLLVMHQSCEGFIPQIATVEMQLKMLKGVAKVVALGDLHVAKVIDLADDCRITYPGSIENCSTSEPKDKSVNLITFTEGVRRAEIQTIPISTRRMMEVTVNSPVELEALRGQIYPLEIKQRGAPILVIHHNPDMAREVKAFRNELLRIEPDWMIRLHPQTALETELPSFLRETVNTKHLMEDILVEIIPQPDIQTVALDLWKNPQNTDQILSTMREGIVAELTTVAPAPMAS